MSSGSTKPPKAPDPQVIIDAQTAANRYNESTPYGSSTWTTDENGNATRTQSLSPELQASFDRASMISQKDPEMAERYELPSGYESLQSAIGQRVGQNYGGPAKQQTQAMQQPNAATMKQPYQG